MDFKPEGYPSLSPYLIVTDAERTLRFVEAAFGATRLRVIARDDAPGLAHAEARIDDSVLMMGEAPQPVPAHVHLYVRDVMAAFARAKAAGGRVVQEPARSGDGDCRGGIDDGNGTTWWLSQQDG